MMKCFREMKRHGRDMEQETWNMGDQGYTSFYEGATLASNHGGPKEGQREVTRANRSMGRNRFRTGKKEKMPLTPSFVWV